VLRSLAGHFALTVPLSIQVFLALANLMQEGNPVILDKYPIKEGVQTLLVTTCYTHRCLGLA